MANELGDIKGETVDFRYEGHNELKTLVYAAITNAKKTLNLPSSFVDYKTVPLTYNGINYNLTFSIYGSVVRPIALSKEKKLQEHILSYLYNLLNGSKIDGLSIVTIIPPKPVLNGFSKPKWRS